MKIVKTERTSAVIRARWLVVQRASENPDWARSTRVRHIATDGSANKLLSGATARHLGNGLWNLTSSRPDGADIAPAVTLMRCQWTPDLAERESRRRERDDALPGYIKLDAAVGSGIGRPVTSTVCRRRSTRPRKPADGRIRTPLPTCCGQQSCT
ncbi:MAG: hypothetical protein HC794_09055 [Nitrospiraceae bacterium]|nr:hypothetical protein [Nitrospiraceae bacterium]